MEFVCASLRFTNSRVLVCTLTLFMPSRFYHLVLFLLYPGQGLGSVDRAREFAFRVAAAKRGAAEDGEHSRSRENIG